MTAYLCPVFQEPQFTNNDEFLSGGLLWFYEAGSSTLATSYTTIGGDIAWSNPIVLNSRGESGGTIWLDPDVSYRIVLEGKPYYGQTHGVVITEHDDITGIPVVANATEWVEFGSVPTYVSTTSFSVQNDYRSIFVTNRKLLITIASVSTVHSVTSSSFASGVTTVNVTGLISPSIESVAYSFVTPSSVPDRYEDLTVTDALDVGGNAVIDGNATIGGNTAITGTLTVNGNAAWTNANNTFGTSVSPNSGFITFANGFKFYREVKTISFAGGSSIINGSDTFSSPFATACFQVMATLGLETTLGLYVPIISVSNVTVNGFDYRINFSSTTPAGTYSINIFYLALGY